MSNIDNLINQLASDGAMPPRGYMGRFSVLLAASLFLSVLILMGLYGAPFSALPYVGWGPYLAKWAYSVVLVIAAIFALYGLGRPGTPTTKKMLFLVIPFAAVFILSMGELVRGETLHMGETWSRCLTSMALLSPIAFACAVLGVRQLAPVDLRAGGLAAGLFGGGIAASAYAPYCAEQGMLYMLTFYCLPTLVMAGIGWLCGPKLLRW